MCRTINQTRALAAPAGRDPIVCTRRLSEAMRDNSGQVAIEYALILASVALGGLGVTSTLLPDLTAMFGDVQTALCEQLKTVCFAS